MRILYQGLLRSPASWARVGRGYLEGLLGLGLDVAALRSRGFRHDPSFPLPAGLSEISLEEALSGPEPDVGLGFVHPPLAKRFLGKRRVELLVWESDVLPAGWADALLEAADRVAVPSSFAREALLRSGFPADRADVVPYGHDVRDAGRKPERSSGSAFAILSVAAPHWRKGIRELLLAYRRAFRRGDGAILRLKTTYDPGAARRRRPFEIPSWAELLAACGLEEPDAPRVALDSRTLGDAEMLALYREADLYVQASWGESFGLALLEAMAAGLPTVATGWGGHRDFFPGGPDAIPYRLEDAGDRLYEAAPGARVAIPSIEALAERLRWHFEHREESLALGEAGRKAAEGLTWAEAARKLAAVLERTAREGPRRASRRQAVEERDPQRSEEHDREPRG